MKLRNITIFVVVLLLLDQALKIWIKTHLCIDEAIEIFPWFQLRFVENNGAAFGMQIANAGGFDWGKTLSHHIPHGDDWVAGLLHLLSQPQKE